MSAEKFAAILNRAATRKGGEQRLFGMVSAPLERDEILTIPDDRFLAEFTKKVFQSGFVWRVVEQKWPAFETEFFQFDIEKILLMPDEMFEKKATNPEIIRNLRKVMSIRDNAMMIKDASKQAGSFAEFVSGYLDGKVIELWAYLKKHGTRLGGNTGPDALRMLGIDTFLLSNDVESYFRQHKLIEGAITSKRSLTTVNEQFNQWHQESGLSLQSISQILAYSCGDNSRQVE